MNTCECKKINRVNNEEIILEGRLEELCKTEHPYPILRGHTLLGFKLMLDNGDRRIVEWPVDVGESEEIMEILKFHNCVGQRVRYEKRVPVEEPCALINHYKLIIIDGEGKGREYTDSLKISVGDSEYE